MESTQNTANEAANDFGPMPPPEMVQGAKVESKE